MKPALRRTWFAVLVVVTILAWLPVLSVIASGVAADALGCALDEGSAHACLLWGTDIGPWLYSGFVMGWFALLTMPLMMGTAIVWGVLLVKRLIRALRRRAS